MFLPTSPRPPRGITRRTWSLTAPSIRARAGRRPQPRACRRRRSAEGRRRDHPSEGLQCGPADGDNVSMRGILRLPARRRRRAHSRVGACRASPARSRRAAAASSPAARRPRDAARDAASRASCVGVVVRRSSRSRSARRGRGASPRRAPIRSTSRVFLALERRARRCSRSTSTGAARSASPASPCSRSASATASARASTPRSRRGRQSTRSRAGASPRDALLEAATLALATAGAGGARLPARSPHAARRAAAARAGARSPARASGSSRASPRCAALGAPRRRTPAAAASSTSSFRWLSLPLPRLRAARARLHDRATRRLGLVGLLAFALPPALLLASVQALRCAGRARWLAEVERATRRSRRSNADLRDLFDFARRARGAQATTARALADYAQALARARSSAAGSSSPSAPSCGEERERARCSAGRVVGDLRRRQAATSERWRAPRATRSRRSSRPRSTAAIARRGGAHDATAATIAALSRSLAAKDTLRPGGHTDRVAEIAVALARRLGYQRRRARRDLDRRAAPRHRQDRHPRVDPAQAGPARQRRVDGDEAPPVVSEFILSGADLPPIVLEIARSSHERIDGRGYPDGLARRGDPAAGADRARRRRLRRADDRPPLPARAPAARRDRGDRRATPASSSARSWSPRSSASTSRSRRCSARSGG